MTGILTDIQRMSLHDGPGIRTTVFCKGCPLRCDWCHNPECISPLPQTLFYPEKCIGCGRCNEGCYAGARVRCGETYAPEDVLRIASEDALYYGREGGVTFSGGEPLAQAAFVRECTDLLQQAGIRVAIETSLFLYEEALLSRMQCVMADLKLFDDAQHIRYTGVSNRPILAHLQALDKLGVPILLRTPVIPGITGNEENLRAIAAFARSLNHLAEYRLLPYHPLGEEKRRALSLPPHPFAVPTAEEMKEYQRYAELC